MARLMSRPDPDDRDRRTRDVIARGEDIRRDLLDVLAQHGAATDMPHEVRWLINHTVFELAGVWNPSAGRYQGLDVFAGLRYIDIDFGAQFDPVNPLFNTTSFDGSESFNDFMLGARYTWALNDRWGVTVRGDGSFGDTEGTWNASGVVNYRMTHGAWLFGYRYLSVELENGGTDIDLTLDGPMIGYGFTF